MVAMYFATPGISWLNRLLTGFSDGSLIEQEITVMASQRSKTSTPAGVPTPAELLTPKEYAQVAKPRSSRAQA